jgi:hypothetical protein
MIKEKKTGEKYPSKSAMMKHEKKETKSFEKKEMKKTPPTKQLAKHDMGRKTSAAKMKKC